MKKYIFAAVMCLLSAPGMAEKRMVFPLMDGDFVTGELVAPNECVKAKQNGITQPSDFDVQLIYNSGKLYRFIMGKRGDKVFITCRKFTEFEWQ